ncbi:MAG: hypothetical protein ACHREM_11700 [Polyangiales bacterium]
MAAPFTLKRGFDRNDARVRPEHTVVQMLDASTARGDTVDGHLFASTPSTFFAIACDAFKGARFSIERRRLKLLRAFLAACQGDVEFRHTDAWTILAADDGTSFGWTTTAPTHAALPGVMKGTASLCLRLPAGALRTALAYVCAGTSPRHMIVYLAYSIESESAGVYFTGRDGSHGASPPIPALQVTGSTPNDLRVRIDPECFANVLRGVSGPVIDLRIRPLPSKNPEFRDDALIAVSETLWLDSRGRVVADGRVAVGPTDAHRCQTMWCMFSLPELVIPPTLDSTGNEDPDYDDYVDNYEDRDDGDEVRAAPDAT